MNADDQLCRIIFCICFELSPLPGNPPGASFNIILQFTRNGMTTGRNGRPRPPKTRTIDLRAGDDVKVNRRWRRVLGVKAYRDGYATAEQLEGIGDGYVVRPTTLA